MQSQHSSLRRLSIPHGAGNRSCGVSGRHPTLLWQRHQVDRALKLIMDKRARPWREQTQTKPCSRKAAASEAFVPAELAPPPPPSPPPQRIVYNRKQQKYAETQGPVEAPSPKTEGQNRRIIAGRRDPRLKIIQIS